MTDWMTLGTRDELVQNAGRRYDVGDHRIAVFLIGTDIYAIGDRCSHADASLSEGELFDNEVECPRHGSAFDVTTGVPASLPATSPVPVYETRQLDGAVQVRIKEQA